MGGQPYLFNPFGDCCREPGFQIKEAGAEPGRPVGNTSHARIEAVTEDAIEALREELQLAGIELFVEYVFFGGKLSEVRIELR